MAQDDARLGTLGGLFALALLAAFWPSVAAAQTCDAPFMTDLVTGTGIHVGHVKVAMTPINSLSPTRPPIRGA